MKTEKYCTVCKILKDLSEYTFDKRATDGRTSGCKQCFKNAHYERTKRYQDEKINVDPNEIIECLLCHKNKLATEYGKDKTKKNGLQRYCKTCHNNQSRDQRRINREKNKSGTKPEKNKRCPRCYIIKEPKDYYLDRNFPDCLSHKCKLCTKILKESADKAKTRREKRIIKLNELRMQGKIIKIEEKKCKTCLLIKHYTQFHNNEADISGLTASCKQCIKERQYIWTKNKLLTDKEFNILHIHRKRIRNVISKKRESSSAELLGAPIKKVIEHIESLFDKDMTWENRKKTKDSFGWLYKFTQIMLIFLKVNHRHLYIYLPNFFSFLFQYFLRTIKVED